MLGQYHAKSQAKGALDLIEKGQSERGGHSFLRHFHC